MTPRPKFADGSLMGICVPNFTAMWQVLVEVDNVVEEEAVRQAPLHPWLVSQLSTFESDRSDSRETTARGGGGERTRGGNH